MRHIRFNMPRFGVVKFLGMICICTLLLFSSISPAYSSPNKADSDYPTPTYSHPRKGEDQLLNVEKKTWDFLDKDKTFSPDKMQKEANEGINEVQGAADINKMKRPSNSQSATTVEEQVSNTLSKITGNH
jgi:hypothetical protein